jgi:hypothetical protein
MKYLFLGENSGGRVVLPDSDCHSDITGRLFVLVFGAIRTQLTTLPVTVGVGVVITT